MEIKAFLLWHYVSAANGRVLDSSISEFQGDFNKLRKEEKEVKKRTEKENTNTAAVLHQIVLLSIT